MRDALYLDDGDIKKDRFDLKIWLCLALTCHWSVPLVPTPSAGRASRFARLLDCCFGADLSQR